MSVSNHNAPPARRRLKATDLFQIRLIGEAQISPDGTCVCFVQKVFVPKENKYRSHLWMVPAAGGVPRRLTSGDHRDFAPTWSPDGSRIAFLSDRSGSDQIWIIPSDGGQPRKITAIKGGTGHPVWAPNGRWIACTLLLDEKGLQPEEEPDEANLPPRERYTRDVRWVTTLPFKENGVGFIGDKFRQIAVVDADGVNPPRVLTGGRMSHTNPAWSPDGRYLAFSMGTPLLSEVTDPTRIFVRDIGLIPAEGGAVRRLTLGLGPAYSPVFSPDGRRIAYIGHARQYGEYTEPSVWVVSVEGGDPRDVTAGYDRPLADRSIDDLRTREDVSLRPAWSPDGRFLYYLSSSRGMTHLVRVNMQNGRVQPVTRGRRVIYHFSLSRDGRRAVVCHEDPVTPNDVFLLELGDAVQEVRLTAVNMRLLSSVTLAVPEPFTFPSTGGVTVEGWIMRPPGTRQAIRTPAVLEIHGGPTVMYGYVFFFEFQLLAAHGITVVYSNPRGSMGYGQAFTAAIRGNSGNLDYQDVMNAMSAAMARGGIDPGRLGVAGGSYGGFMVNWILGHTGRFKAAIAMRSISDRYSFFGTSDFGFTSIEDFGSPPWRIPDVYLAHSPISYVERVTTPVLMIQSEEDLRTPMPQAEEFYTALKVLGREVILLRYPGENHELSRSGKPWHRVHRLETILRWFTRRLCPE